MHLAPMNFLRRDIENYLRQFLTDYRFHFVLEGEDRGSTFVAYQSEGLVLAFYWSIDDGQTARVGRSSLSVDRSKLRALIGRSVSIPHYFPSFYRRYTDALREYEYPSEPTDAEFYRLMDLSLREFMSAVQSGRVKICELTAA